MRKALAGVLALISLPAAADPLHVYDVNGKLVGQLMGMDPADGSGLVLAKKSCRSPREGWQEENSMLKSLIGLAALLAASPALAQQQGPLQVFDTHGTEIGVVIDNYSVAREYNDQWYQLYLYQNALIADATLFFQSRNCTGQPYVGAQIPNEFSLMPVAFYQAVPLPSGGSKIIWIADPSSQGQLTPVGSYWYQELDAATGQVSGFCEALLGASLLVQPAIPLDATSQGFHPPFCVSAHSDRPCQTKVADR